MNHPLVVNVKTDGCDVYVGRPSKWGNPFKLTREADRPEVLRLYTEWLKEHPEIERMAKRELKGKILGCHCAPKPCHADILAEMANA